MKLTLAIIVCVGLLCASAKPLDEPDPVLDRKYQKFLNMAEKRAHVPNEDQMYHLCEERLPSRDNLNSKGNEFKSICIKRFGKIYGLNEEKWNIEDESMCRDAYDTLTEQIRNVINHKYKKFVKMANKYKKYTGIEERERSFKSECIKAFEDKYGSNEEEWDIENKVMCETAHFIFNEQLKIVRGVKYQRMLRLAENHATWDKESWDNLKSADYDFKEECVLAYEDKQLPHRESIWDISNYENIKWAYKTLADQLRYVLYRKYTKFYLMALTQGIDSDEDKKYNLDSYYFNLDDADDDFKSNCIKAFEKKCGPINWESLDPKMRKDANAVLNEQITIFMGVLEKSGIDEVNRDKLKRCSKHEIFLYFFSDWFKIKKADPKLSIKSITEEALGKWNILRESKK